MNLKPSSKKTKIWVRIRYINHLKCLLCLLLAQMVFITIAIRWVYSFIIHFLRNNHLKYHSGRCLSCLPSFKEEWSTCWKHHYNDVWWYCQSYRVSFLLFYFTYVAVIKTVIFNCRNPTKGIIINEPNGENVYAGLIKDYVGEVSFKLWML